MDGNYHMHCRFHKIFAKEYAGHATMFGGFQASGQACNKGTKTTIAYNGWVNIS